MNLCPNHPVNLTTLLETRMLVQAASGGGKSWALRRLLEQTAPHVQQLVIDPEGEFATLREKFDYVIAAPHDGDAVATPQTAALLARRLLESGVSAILDIYDLKAHERMLFVRRFFDALVNAPKALWHPVLIALDEAHVYAPQAGSAESLGAVVDIATRGRKRGQCLVAATQRLSKVHKDVAAELGNKLIGRTGLDVDITRAADELGMTKRDAIEALRNLAPGQFYAYGPALSRAVERVTIGPVQTTHPKAGHRLLAPPPPASDKLRRQLAKLADLQKDAEVEARTVEELKAENAKLRREATLANKRAEQAGVPQVEVDRRIIVAVAQAKREASAAPAPGLSEDGAARKALQRIAEAVGRIRIDDLTALGITVGARPTAAFNVGVRPAVAAIKSSIPVSLPKSADRHIQQVPNATSTGITGPEQRILDAIAWLESIGVDQPEQLAVAFLAGYTFGAGSYNNPRGRLNQSGHVEYLPGQRIRLTDAGRALANAPGAPATTAELHERILAKLPGPEQRLLRPLLDAYPNAMSNADLAGAAGYTPGAGSFNNPRGRLRTLGLIDYPVPGQCVARALLFPKERA